MTVVFTPFGRRTAEASSFFTGEGDVMAPVGKTFCCGHHPFLAATEFVAADGVDKENVHVSCFLLRVSVQKSRISCFMPDIENFCDAVLRAAEAMERRLAGFR